MAMALYRIKIDLSPVVGAAANLQAEIMPRITRGLERVSEITVNLWRERVRQQKGIWIEERKRYESSIRWDWTSPTSTEVWTDYDVADLIENGRPARDLKKMLNTSQKVRRTEDGRRFLVIPFRHNTPGNEALAPAMSKQAYAMAKGMKLSRTTTEYQRPMGQMMSINRAIGMRASPIQMPFASDPKTKGAVMVKATHYAWGGRLTAKALREAGMDAADVRKYAGMVRMNTSSGNQRSSQYLTFRVMIEGSNGWIIPAQPGRHIVADIAQEMEPIAQAILAKAAELGG